MLSLAAVLELKMRLVSTRWLDEFYIGREDMASAGGGLYLRRVVHNTVPLRKRAHGQCNLHWEKIGGWDNIRGISVRCERAPR